MPKELSPSSLGFRHSFVSRASSSAVFSGNRVTNSGGLFILLVAKVYLEMCHERQSQLPPLWSVDSG
jgi:hypothetical protein